MLLSHKLLLPDAVLAFPAMPVQGMRQTLMRTWLYLCACARVCLCSLVRVFVQR